MCKLLSWEILARLKRLGGANLKPAQDMNCAMLSKMAWSVLCYPGDPWCAVMRSKYGVKEEDGAYLRMKVKSSQV